MSGTPRSTGYFLSRELAEIDVADQAHAAAPAAVARLHFDHTSFLQKVIGDATPSHILKQLEELRS